MNEELNKKLAEWAGFKWDNKEWYYPRVGEKAQIVSCLILPTFTQSLDACFKWLVPKLKCEVVELVPTTSGGWGCVITPEYWVDNVSALTNENSPALALCLAIEKLIDGGVV